MANYRVYFSSIFLKKKSKMDHEFQRWVDKMVRQLEENPFVGDPLEGDWFREKNLVNTAFIF